jgi:hypothetical protein
MEMGVWRIKGVERSKTGGNRIHVKNKRIEKEKE